MKITKKYKTKKRLKMLSQAEQSNSLLRNIEGAGILSEIHPVAAGVYNTTYFVIIPHRNSVNKDYTSNSVSGFQINRVFDKENQSISKTLQQPKTVSRVKPKHTYRELITKALMDKHSLTLSGIYNWICTFYPFYSASDDKWKNSIRHNLSLYPEFLKGAKNQQSAGHLWYLDEDFRRRHEEDGEEPESYSEFSENKNSHMERVEETVDDVIESETMISEIPSFFHDEARFLPHSTPPELQKSAEEILAGVKRPTAVEGNHCLPITFSSSQDDFQHQCLKFPFFEEERQT